VKKLLTAIIVAVIVFWWLKVPTVTAPGSDVSFRYRVEYTGGAGRRDRVPLLVALHGNGDKPEHFFETALDGIETPARVVLIQAPIPTGVGGGAWPMDTAGVRRYGPALASAIRVLTEEFPSAGRPVVFGFSGGAVMAYYLAAAYPERYGAVVPVSGRLTADMIDAVPALSESSAEVYAFHGSQDRVIGIAGGRAAAGLLESRGIRVRFSVFDGGHLGVFTNAKPAIQRVLEAVIARSGSGKL